MSKELPNIPFQSPIVPEMLTNDSKLQFRCHKGIACFNECCRNIDIALTPYDVLRLKRRLDMTTDEFLPKYTVPYEMDAHGLPGIKLRPVENGTSCQFMTEEGCSVYEDRPTACRYYPLGLLSMKHKDAPSDEEQYAMVREDHCLGHNEDRTLTVGEYRTEQGLNEYDPHTRGWRQIILKKKSAGPSIGQPSELSLQLFFMASYHIDQFQKFVTSEQFQANYDLPADLVEKLKTDQEAVIDFGQKFMKQVLFGEKMFEEKEGAYEARLERAKKKQEELKALAEAQAKAAAEKATQSKGGDSEGP